MNTGLEHKTDAELDELLRRAERMTYASARAPTHATKTASQATWNVAGVGLCLLVRLEQTTRKVIGLSKGCAP